MACLPMAIALASSGLTYCAHLPPGLASSRWSHAPMLNAMAATETTPTPATLPEELELRKRPNVVKRAFTSTCFLLINVIVLAVVYPFVLGALAYGKIFDNERRRASDYIVQIWARLTMTLFGAEVHVEGAHHLPPADEAVIYTPNHCAFLDVFFLSGFLPRRFKYVSKVENLRIPFIGWAMCFAKHIAISRADRASQLKTLKEAIATLQNGNSLVVFPEGTRSKDGVLADFKKGPFTMAARANVRIVPISIVGTHLYQPPGTVFPFMRPRGIRIICQPPLEPPEPKKEAAAMEATRHAILSALPASMRPASDI